MGWRESVYRLKEVTELVIEYSGEGSVYKLKEVTKLVISSSGKGVL